MNVLAQLSPERAAAVRKALPPEFGRDWFVGFAVDARNSKGALSRLDDAAAEAAARLVGTEVKPRSAPRKRVRRR